MDPSDWVILLRMGPKKLGREAALERGWALGLEDVTSTNLNEYKSPLLSTLSVATGTALHHLNHGWRLSRTNRWQELWVEGDWRVAGSNFVLPNAVVPMQWLQFCGAG